ncbi:MAG: hypothetical protein SVU88_04630 [Candidatus Nanohaloarchaea archaeon]|nr:hypothetical protein [Candidatus Nanohaloarchaea archaeon]
MTERVRSLLESAGQPLSTNKVAEQLDIDWHTAKKRLDRLVEEGDVNRSRISSRLTLYWDREIPF